MSKNDDIITQTGITTDGKMVVDGIWKMYETHGLPLDILFTICIDKKCIPDWILLYKQMRMSGMGHDRILSKLEESINDSFGKKFCEYVILKLDELFGEKTTKSTEADKFLSKIKNEPQIYVANVDWTEEDVEVIASCLEEARQKLRSLSPNWKFIIIVDVLDIPKETK